VLEVNGTRHPLQPPGLVIGRGSEADLRINDPGISRRHAQIRVSPAGQGLQIDIVDLGSTNGIMVTGQKVQQAALREGSRIEIGSTRMLVHAPGGR
jgi:pSer/pThr/pTyr-binding forkhead associated (FHA) protein